MPLAATRCRPLPSSDRPKLTLTYRSVVAPARTPILPVRPHPTDSAALSTKSCSVLSRSRRCAARPTVETKRYARLSALAPQVAVPGMLLCTPSASVPRIETRRRRTVGGCVYVAMRDSEHACHVARPAKTSQPGRSCAATASNCSSLSTVSSCSLAAARLTDDCQRTSASPHKPFISSTGKGNGSGSGTGASTGSGSPGTDSGTGALCGNPILAPRQRPIQIASPAFRCAPRSDIFLAVSRLISSIECQFASLSPSSKVMRYRLFRL